MLLGHFKSYLSVIIVAIKPTLLKEGSPLQTSQATFSSSRAYVWNIELFPLLGKYLLSRAGPWKVSIIVSAVNLIQQKKKPQLWDCLHRTALQATLWEHFLDCQLMEESLGHCARCHCWTAAPDELRIIAEQATKQHSSMVSTSVPTLSFCLGFA